GWRVSPRVQNHPAGHHRPRLAITHTCPPERSSGSDRYVVLMTLEVPIQPERRAGRTTRLKTLWQVFRRVSREQELWIRPHERFFQQREPPKVIDPKRYDVLFGDAVLPKLVVVIGHVPKCVQQLVAKRLHHIVLEPIRTPAFAFYIFALTQLERRAQSPAAPIPTEGMHRKFLRPNGTGQIDALGQFAHAMQPCTEFVLDLIASCSRYRAIRGCLRNSTFSPVPDGGLDSIRTAIAGCRMPAQRRIENTERSAGQESSVFFVGWPLEELRKRDHPNRKGLQPPAIAACPLSPR